MKPVHRLVVRKSQKNKDFCRKIRETEKQIQQLKAEGDYDGAKYLGWLLRNAWWGYKRYEFK